MMLAARAQGLGAVLTTPNSFTDDTLRAGFQIPEEATPAAIVPVGCPDGQDSAPLPASRPRR